MQDAQWRRLNGSIDTSFVNNVGRLILGPNTIGNSENPQSFEDQYYCEENGVKSSPVSFHGKALSHLIEAAMYFVLFVVIPSRISAANTVRYQLEENVAIDCPLRFGNLREEWNVEWMVTDNRNRPVSLEKVDMRLERILDSNWLLMHQLILTALLFYAKHFLETIIRKKVKPLLWSYFVSELCVCIRMLMINKYLSF